MICSSGIGFDPLVDGQRLTFGFEGIWQGTAVLYDHQTRSLWLHLTGLCIRGPKVGTTLTPLETGRHTTWQEWRASHPETDVLASDPEREKGGPHGYFGRRGAASGQAYLPPTFPGTIEVDDDRLDAHALLHGVRIGDAARAYPYAVLREQRIVNDELGGQPITVWFHRASRSSAAFDRRLGTRTLSFERDEDGTIRDRETKSTWTMEGRATAGALEGKQLARAPGLMSEWYGWRAAHADTTIYGR